MLSQGNPELNCCVIGVASHVVIEKQSITEGSLHVSITDFPIEVGRKCLIWFCNCTVLVPVGKAKAVRTCKKTCVRRVEVQCVSIEIREMNILGEIVLKKARTEKQYDNKSCFHRIRVMLPFVSNTSPLKQVAFR